MAVASKLVPFKRFRITDASTRFGKVTYSMNTEAAGHGDGDGGGSVVRGVVRLEERAGVVKGPVFVTNDQASCSRCCIAAARRGRSRWRRRTVGGMACRQRNRRDQQCTPVCILQLYRKIE
eukprot:gene25413-2788_t